MAQILLKVLIIVGFIAIIITTPIIIKRYRNDRLIERLLLQACLLGLFISSTLVSFFSMEPTIPILIDLFGLIILVLFVFFKAKRPVNRS
jgi:hypothetical protein